MRRLFALFLIPGLLAMGGAFGFEKQPPAEPAGNFSAAVTDRLGFETHVDRAACDGKTHLTGEVGMGKLTVDFSRIRSVKITPSDQGMVRAELVYWDGDQAAIRVKNYLQCGGRSKQGDFQIRIDKIKTVAFDPPATDQPSKQSE